MIEANLYGFLKTLKSKYFLSAPTKRSLLESKASCSSFNSVIYFLSASGFSVLKEEIIFGIFEPILIFLMACNCFFP